MLFSFNNIQQLFEREKYTNKYKYIYIYTSLKVCECEGESVQCFVCEDKDCKKGDLKITNISYLRSPHLAAFPVNVLDLVCL